jgi:flagellar biosynthesis GTPase FlhF
MLQVFRVQPRSQRIKRSAEFSSPHRGYAARDFVLLWARYLDPVGGYPGTEAEAEQWCTAEERGQLLALEQMAARDQQARGVQKEQKQSQEQPEVEEQATTKPSNDAGCSRVATSPQDSPEKPEEHKTWEETATEEQKALLAEVRRMQNSLPKCAEREMIRVAPSFLRR